MSGFKKWLENYWYHYKWHTIIIGFFAVVAVICTVQLLNKEDYDAYVLYAGGGVVFGEQEQAVTNALSYVSDDYDGNGKKNLCMTVLTVLSDEELESRQEQAAEEVDDQIAYNYENRAQALKNFDLEVMTGQSYLCFMSEYMYSRCESKGRFVPLTDVFDTLPECAANEYAIRLSDTEFGRYFSDAFECMGDGVLVCLRQISISDAQSARACAEYEKYPDMLRNIVSFRLK